MPETIMLDTPDGVMGLYDAEPAGPATSAVIVLQEAFGVTDHIEDVTRRFAAEGYRAVAPHLYHRTGGPALAYDDVADAMPHMHALAAPGLVEDLAATLGYLAGLGIDSRHVGVVGFCMGGNVSFFTAVEFPVGAAVTFYGGQIGSDRWGAHYTVDQLQAPWLGLYGDLDKNISVEEVEALRVALATVPIETEIVRYAEADHGFHCDARPSYHPASAQDGWSRTLAWFARYVEH